MTDAEKKVLDEEVVVESVDVEVGTMEDVDAIMKKFDRESNTRVWEGTPKKILRYVLAAFMLFMVYMNLWATWSGQIRRCLFVGFVILFTFFIYPVKKGNVKPNSMPWYDILLAVAGCIPYFYYVANFKRIVAMGIAIGQTEVILGIIGTLVLAECCRRAVGLPILIVAGCFVLYAFIGRGMSLDEHHQFLSPLLRRSPSARPTLRYSCCSARSLRRPVSPTSSSTARTRWSAGRPAVPRRSRSSPPPCAAWSPVPPSATPLPPVP